ncbi:MAG: MFS transporter [Novosphingobium sp. SCN 63-17]|uniref:nitrate/nitrite transporter n=1 Tax=unclassified Novosphingobium TaxID=2644732 RepID=UPI00086C2107|nr:MULTISPECIES: MFS transporter [unclassified Novosphingobium]MDR6707503.1 NNP family nitrate/nitrite transporter-like MFS transporter [Novosphingobium sp. 1748]ODU83417.1 MAG: MFS transporter [Novosphingobium sp. SCN 63-17]OJX96313.1 MAG: MFS transporter [Novosphingobium sp. 63-713]
MSSHVRSPGNDPQRALGLSTLAFAVCFAVWTIFGIIGIRIKSELGLNDTQFGLLVGTPILTGSLLRLLLGVWTDRYGGRAVFALTMLASAASTMLLTYAVSYPAMLLAALGLGLAGGGFAIGVAYVSKWYPPSRQGAALGFFGMGNVGAFITQSAAPFVMVAFGWQAVARIWALALAATAVLFFLLAKDDPELAARRKTGARAKGLAEQLQPLGNEQVWRFSLYYFFVFGAFVALALWLPKYLIGVYGLDVKAAGVLAATFSLSASLFRAYGGILSDRYGARRIMYATFGVSLLLLFMLSYPATDYVIHGIKGDIRFSTSMGLVPFVLTVFVLGFFMALGMAAVFKHIPVYYPDHVGPVGGLVGMVGGLGGFVLPIVFGVVSDLTGIWTSCFAVLFLLVGVALAWMHGAIRQMERKANRIDPQALPQMPEMIGLHDPVRHAPPTTGRVLADWRPEDPAFWAAKGEGIARRNLFLSIPALLLAFAVWMVWSVVVAKLPLIGFDYTTDQLFWLAALPGLSGATLRIFYSFMVPVFGGRLWTTLSTASLLIPAFGIGYAVQNPGTPYFIFLVLALLCGFGGGNFASSMANIGFFFPTSRKGSALALNGGLGNLGVSVMQFLVPVVITGGVFGTLGGEPQLTGTGARLWLQNAGFVWVPFIIASSLLAWFGMNDIADAKATFAEQAVIFQRRHTWLMCWLYTGTFGSFIGFSASLPLLAKKEFPDVDALKYVWIAPLVGAISRAATGWVADRWGGARVTLWVFMAMIAGTFGVMYSLDAKDFGGFLAMFVFMFFVTGIGNASTFQMIPNIMRLETPRLMPELGPVEAEKQADKEAAAIVGFTSAIAAYGAFYIPKAFGTSITLTGSPQPALWGFLLFYISCAGLTWWVYARRSGLLHATEHGLPSPLSQTQGAPA